MVLAVEGATERIVAGAHHFVHYADIFIKVNSFPIVSGNAVVYVRCKSGPCHFVFAVSDRIDNVRGDIVRFRNDDLEFEVIDIKPILIIGIVMNSNILCTGWEFVLLGLDPIGIIC